MIDGSPKSMIRVRTMRASQPQACDGITTPQSRYRLSSRGSLPSSRRFSDISSKHTKRIRSSDKNPEADDGFEFSDVKFKDKVASPLAQNIHKKRMIIQPISDYSLRDEPTIRVTLATPNSIRQDTTGSKDSEIFSPFVCLVKELLEPHRKKTTSRSPLVRVRKRFTDNMVKEIPS